MLSQVLQYGALKTKISALKAKQLNRSDYETMLASDDVAQVVRYLKNNTDYAAVLAPYNENDVHRADLEAALNSYQFLIFKKLYVFAKGDTRNFFRYPVLQYEIEVMKRVLRSLETRDSQFGTEQINHFLLEHSGVDFERLLTATTVQEYISNLKGTKYYVLLSPFLMNTEHANLFSVEMTLDLYYFKTVSKHIEKYLKGEDKKVVGISFGSEIDMLNLIWIYRCKKYYDSPEELIYTYILPYHYRLRPDTLKQLVKTASVEEYIRMATEKTPYGKLFSNLDERFIEENYQSAAYGLGKHLERKFPYSIAALTTYIHSMETEKENLITLAEGIRYHIDPEEIRRHIQM